jgi:hypothetical protein
MAETIHEGRQHPHDRQACLSDGHAPNRRQHQAQGAGEVKIVDCEQYSDQWWKARCGKPSASSAKKLVTSTGAPSKQMKDFAIDLANAMFAGREVDPWEGNSATQRGTELEPEARMAYELIAGVEVEEVGMFTDDMDQYIASPDGVIGSDGLLEIKNLTAKNHTKALLYYAKHRKVPTDYVPQLQMQLLVSEREYVDIFFHHPDLPCLTIRQHPDPKIIEPLKQQLAAVIAERNLVLNQLKEF